MKKILLTFLAGFCFSAIAMAQEPAKAASAKKKPNKTSQKSAAATGDSEAVKAKEAELKGIKPAPAATKAPAQSAAALVDPRSN